MITDRYQSTAIYKGEEIFADDFDIDTWSNLQETYKIGEIVMSCCKAPAIPKTSPNGLRFFAHHNAECSTAEETIWHQDTKETICSALHSLGIEANKEVSANNRKWQADVYFEYPGMKFAIEIQRSYQHLDEYLRRQQLYEAEGIKCFWVLKPEQYMTLTKSMGKRRLKQEFGGKMPKSDFQSCLPGLPIVYADGSPLEIKGAGFYQSTMEDWLISILKNRFKWFDGTWRVID